MTKQSRERADQALVRLGLAESRAKAQALIMAGKVFAGERRVEKSGETLKPGLALRVTSDNSLIHLSCDGGC